MDGQAAVTQMPHACVALQAQLVEEQDNATSTGQIKPDQMIATLRGKQLESLARGRPLGTPMIWKHWDAAFVERKQWTAGADHAETYVAYDPCRDYAGQNERPCVPK